MANIHGIEVSSQIYNLEDTQGRAATQTAQNTATNALNKADSNETAIDDITQQSLTPIDITSSISVNTDSFEMTAEDVGLTKVFKMGKVVFCNICVHAKVTISGITNICSSMPISKCPFYLNARGALNARNSIIPCFGDTAGVFSTSGAASLAIGDRINTTFMYLCE